MNNLVLLWVLTWIGIQIHYHGHRGLVITLKLIIAINTCAKEWNFIRESWSSKDESRIFRIRSDIHFTQVVPIINEPTQRPEQKQTVVYTWWNFWRTYWEQAFSTTYWIAILFPNCRHCNGSVYNWWQWNCAIKCKAAASVGWGRRWFNVHRGTEDCRSEKINLDFTNWFDIHACKCLKCFIAAIFIHSYWSCKGFDKGARQCSFRDTV